MKWIENLKMIQKLLSAFIFIALFIAFMGFIGMSNMNKNIKNIYNKDLANIDAINDLKSNSILGERDMLLVTNIAYRPGLDSFKKSIEAGDYADTTELMSQYGEGLLTNKLTFLDKQLELDKKKCKG